VRWPRRWALDLAALAVVQLAVLAACRLAGLSMTMSWPLWQVLDPELLRKAPLESLWYLHSQPPGFNALLAAVLWLSDRTGASPEVVAAGAYYVLGVLSSFALFRTVLLVTPSRRLAWVVTALALANPSYHLFAHVGFYPFVEYSLQALLLLWSALFLARGGSRWLALVVANALALTLTRSLFHPLWAVACLGVVLLCRTWLTRDWRLLLSRPALAAGVCLVLGMLPWPLKNYLVFGDATYSSWAGYNLARECPIPRNPDFKLFTKEGVCSEAVRQDVKAFRARNGGYVPAVLAEVNKSDPAFGRNYNHLVLLRADRDLKPRALVWRRQHLLWWAGKAWRNYLAWTRPCFLDCYSQQVLLDKQVPRACAVAVNAVLFCDVGPLLRRAVPSLGYEWPAQGGLRITLFCVLLFPLLCLAAAAVLWRRRARAGAPEGIAVVALYGLLAPMLTACLTDGAEGNRMRFCTLPCLFVVCAYVGAAAVPWALRRLGRPAMV
jgi:hypothetical protein